MSAVGGNDRDAIYAWLIEMIAALEEVGALIAVLLMHYRDGGASEVELHAIRSTSPGWNDPSAMAETLDRVARRHAAALPGQQTFQCVAVFGSTTSKATVSRFLPLSRLGQLTFGGSHGGSIATEGPTPQGMWAQSQRMAEIVLQGATSKDLAVTQVLGSLVKDLGSLSADLLHKYSEAMIGMGKLASDSQAARAKAAVDLLNARRNAELANTAMKLAPAMVNAVVEKPIFPESTAATGVLRAMARTFTREQVEQLLSASASGGVDAQMAAAGLLDQLDHFRKEDQAEAQKLHALQEQDFPGVDPELDAAGLLDPSAEPLAKLIEKPKTAPKQLADGHAHANGATDATGTSSGASGNEQAPSPSESDELLDELLDAAGGMLPMVLSTLTGTRPKLAERVKARIEKGRK